MTSLRFSAGACTAKSAWLRLILVCLFCAASLPIEAATQGDPNQATIIYSPSIPLQSTERSEVLVERFLEEISTSDAIVFDRFFSPSSRLDWARRQESFGYAALDRF